MPVMTPDDLHRFLKDEFPGEPPNITVDSVDDTTIRVRQVTEDKHLRPGGTISGPTMMGLTDFAMYVAILASVGPVPLAVTTNLNINFLRKPAQRDLIADVKLIKLGKRLAVGDVAIYSEGDDEMVAHATATYSIPPPDRRG